MEISNLDDSQVDSLIKELKEILNKLDINSLSTPFGRIDSRHSLISDINGINFALSIYRGNKESGRFSLDLRFKETHDCLVRLDINGGPHKNPDGTISPSSHIHIYSNAYDKKDGYAYPIDINDFPNIENLYYASISFFDYTNIKIN